MENSILAGNEDKPPRGLEAAQLRTLDGSLWHCRGFDRPSMVLVLAADGSTQRGRVEARPRVTEVSEGAHTWIAGAGSGKRIHR